jgi:hypothetical protein
MFEVPDEIMGKTVDRSTCPLGCKTYSMTSDRQTTLPAALTMTGHDLPRSQRR